MGVHSQWRNGAGRERFFQSEESQPPPMVMRSLSGRLLLLTISFVMLAEVLIYVPSMSRFRKIYLEEHVARAHLAALALKSTPDGMVDEKLERELLRHAEAFGVMLRDKDMSMLALSGDMPPDVDDVYDLRATGFPTWIADAFAAMARTGPRIMRVVGASPKDPDVTVEVILDEKPMRDAMYYYSARILQLSVMISIFTAGLVYLSLHRLMVGPMRRITESMERFRENPEAPTEPLPESGRPDEIGVAQRELAVMQDDLRAALGHKTRLATLGAAVAKINHDLRNSLATAVLVSDRLADLDDPVVKKVTPRLYNAIDRAVTLCSQTMAYAGDAPPAPKIEPFHLSELMAEVGAALRDDGFEFRNDVDFEVTVHADRDQMFRAINNIALNAKQAGAQTVAANASRDGTVWRIEVADDGPGLPPKARDNLFQPFKASARKGGTGLGLAIARDILRAHGGDMALAKTDEAGTTFRLDLPETTP